MVTLEWKSYIFIDIMQYKQETNQIETDHYKNMTNISVTFKEN